MEPQHDQRRVWDIDKRLESLMGCAIRVRAEQVLPQGSNGQPLGPPIGFQNFILPDGSMIDGEPLLVEGVLRTFRRSIAMVRVELDPPSMAGTAEGRVLFRGAPAVILRGPAIVLLHSSHLVERLPGDEQAYWNHLLAADPQLRLPLVDLEV
jgi:hypothetical protein